MSRRYFPGLLALSILCIPMAEALAQTPAVTPERSGTLTTLYQFDGFTDGADPESALVLGPDGSYYGTASSGGQYGYGSIFKVTPGGVLTVLYSFTAFTDGANPFGGLVLGSDGNFYGTAGDAGTATGSGGSGTVFRMTPQGALTVLHAFTGLDGAHPVAALVQGADGSFYGTAQYGGGSGSYGTVFKITSGGTFTQLHNFTGGDGAYPAAGLFLAKDGNFYGTTEQGGAADVGTVFKMTPSGVLTSLHAFNTTDGAAPEGGVVQGADGNFYGTTSYGGTANLGTVFKLTAAGALTTLHGFRGVDGSTPYSALILAADGSFYGTTAYGGTLATARSRYVGGSLFKITSAGAFTSVYAFTSQSDGARPLGALVQGSDGSFYGTTFLAGPQASTSAGIIFRYSN